MTDYPFLGPLTTTDVLSTVRAEDFRQGLLVQEPNGSAPMFMIQSKMKTVEASDPTFNWHTETVPLQAAALTGNGVCLNADLSTAYTTVKAANTPLYLSIAEADVEQFRKGLLVVVRYTSDPTVDVVARVNGQSTKNGDASVVPVTMLEADDNSTEYNLSDADKVLIIGNSNPENAYRPESITYKPTEHNNYTQIVRTPIDLSNTLAATTLRTGDVLTDQRRIGLRDHGLAWEKTMLYGIKTLTYGANNKAERTTQGIFSFIRENAPGNIFNYALETDNQWKGQDWIDGGEDWLDNRFEVIFRYGRKTKLAVGGSGGILGVQRLIKKTGTYEVTTGMNAYGIQVSRWYTVFGTIDFIIHPLMSHEATMRNAMLVYDPENIVWRPLPGRDTKHIPQSKGEGDQTGTTGKDGIEEEWLTEAGLEVQFPNEFGILYGVGLDNTQGGGN